MTDRCPICRKKWEFRTDGNGCVIEYHADSPCVEPVLAPVTIPCIICGEDVAQPTRPPKGGGGKTRLCPPPKECQQIRAVELQRHAQERKNSRRAKERERERYLQKYPR